MNPLLADGDLPLYDAVRPEHVAPAIEALLADAQAALEATTSDSVPATYAALERALDVPVERLHRAWGVVCHLQAVVDTPALRAAHAAMLPRVVDFNTRLAADAGLYAKTRQAAQAETGLDAVQRKALANSLRDFVLGGAELKGAARERFAAIQQRMAELSQRFGDNVLDATDAWSLRVGEAEVAGLPADVRAAARAADAADGSSGYKITLHAPCRIPVLQYATHRPLREAVYRAHATRCTPLGPAALDNTALMDELLALRAEEAALLGHADYAALSLVPKMARSAGEVTEFLRALSARARPFAVAERDRLVDYARRELGLDVLQPWDRAFVAEQLKQATFAFSDEEVRRYFTEPRVLVGLFGLVERLFDVSIEPTTAPVWHPSVRVYRITRGLDDIGRFYLDLHARPGKQAGAWMDEVCGRWRRPDTGALQRPAAHLVCNFTPPAGDQPALLSHDDVVTLFHEFGHGLHHLLTQVDVLALSGIGGVEWDAVEVPSQFMENFCWEWDVLQQLSAHVDTGAPLPRPLFERMQAARHFGAGLRLARHVEYALFDMLLHAAPPRPVDAAAASVRAEVSVYTEPEGLHYPHSFRHIFDGGYAAGYYGYAWAEVLSADAYSAFEESGLFDPGTGRRWRETVLEAGGSRAALDSFVAFRGREPRLDAFLRHQGLVAAPSLERQPGSG